MGETTEISWATGSFNPWWGCSRVSEACRSCYAETFAHRLGLDVWGKNGQRRFFGDKHWNEPLAWNRKAEAAGERRRIFCASMADVFEDHPDLPPWRERLWDLIGKTPWLDWLLLTKRPENIRRMVPWRAAPENVWLGTTTENQKCADERVPLLLENPAVVHFLSCEPLLEALDLTPWLGADRANWILCGGESGAKAHPMHPEWARLLRDQCQAAGVAYHFKQWGEWAPGDGMGDWTHEVTIDGIPRPRTTRAQLEGMTVLDLISHGLDPWYGMKRVGKKAAGRLLDGALWDQMPERSRV